MTEPKCTAVAKDTIIEYRDGIYAMLFQNGTSCKELNEQQFTDLYNAMSTMVEMRQCTKGGRNNE